MRAIPDELLSGPFHRDTALAAGVTARMLDGRRFVRIHPRVYRHRDHELTFEDTVEAARMALPGHACPTGVTRLQLLGLDVGPPRPLRFVVEGKLHLALDDIFLHRTVLLPPTDDVGVTPVAAFVAFCKRSTTIDAIAVGDWLAHRGHLDGDELQALVAAQKWRDGAAEAAWVIQHFVGDARSIPESKARAMLTFAGLPAPMPNGAVELGGTVVHGDLWYPQYRCVVEYEGEQHQRDREQYVADIDRYALYRQHEVHYVQLTKELVGHPRTLVRRVHRALVSRGYDGPPPDFGPSWDVLFARLNRVVPRRRGLRAVSQPPLPRAERWTAHRPGRRAPPER